MSDSTAISSVAPADWLPILEAILAGYGHALSNRVAALGGIAQLLEVELATRAEGARGITTEVALLRVQMDQVRALAADRARRRAPVRAGERLRTAATLLAQHGAARAHRFEIADEPPDVEPLLLWPADHLRAPVLFLLAATEAATKEIRIRVSVSSHEGAVRITALTPLAPEQVRGANAFAALSSFAALERGECTSAAAPDGATALVLDLPGLARASAQRD